MITSHIRRLTLGVKLVVRNRIYGISSPYETGIKGREGEGNEMTKYIIIDHNNIQVRENDDNKDIVILKITDSEIMLKTKRSMISYQVNRDEQVKNKL
jgi:hypothetical protein